MKTYIITEKDIEKLIESLDCSGDSDWWYKDRVEDWGENLVEIDLWEDLENSGLDKPFKLIYKSKEESPKELVINTYWNNGGGVATLREALPYDHEENLWNWFTRTYPDLNPEYYDVHKPVKHISRKKE